MNEQEKVNKWIVLAKMDCKESIDELCRRYMPEIVSISSKYRNKLSDEAAFECSCIRMINYAIKNYGKSNKWKFDDFVRYNIRRLTKMYLAKGSKRTDEVIYADDERINDSGDKDLSFEIVDEVEIVESNAIANEMAALLAQGDPKKKVIIEHWTNGNTNDSKISEILAYLFGGNKESHRKYVQRFRERCSDILVKNGYYPSQSLI